MSRKDSGLKLIAIDSHRNGVTGNPFHVILFLDSKIGGTMLGIVFPETGSCAVLNVEMLTEGNIAFASNSWRGDYFEDDLRKFILKYRNDQREECGLPPLKEGEKEQ